MGWRRSVGVVGMYDKVLAVAGGPCGKHVDRPIESVLHRVYHHVLYGGLDDICQAAGLYAFSIAEGHPDIDAKKRTARMYMRVFLAHDLGNDERVTGYDGMLWNEEAAQRIAPHEKRCWQE